jgi:hypothetical protein
MNFNLFNANSFIRKFECLSDYRLVLIINRDFVAEKRYVFLEAYASDQRCLCFKFELFFSFLGWGETEYTWYVGH